jgi:hypothetical protein
VYTCAAARARSKGGGGEQAAACGELNLMNHSIPTQTQEAARMGARVARTGPHASVTTPYRSTIGMLCGLTTWGGNSHSAKSPGGQSQGVPGGFSVGFSESGEGARGFSAGCEGGPVGPPGPLELAAHADHLRGDGVHVLDHL